MGLVSEAQFAFLLQLYQIELVLRWPQRRARIRASDPQALSLNRLVVHPRNPKSGVANGQRKSRPLSDPALMKPPRHNVPIFWFFIYELTAVISRRAQKTSAVKEKKRLQELEKLAVKVAKASTENLKTWMSRLAKILPRRRKRSSRKTTVLANKNGSVFETAKTQLPDPQRNSF